MPSEGSTCCDGPLSASFLSVLSSTSVSSELELAEVRSMVILSGIVSDLSESISALLLKSLHEWARDSTVISMPLSLGNPKFLLLLPKHESTSENVATAYQLESLSGWVDVRAPWIVRCCCCTGRSLAYFSKSLAKPKDDRRHAALSWYYAGGVGGVRASAKAMLGAWHHID